MILGWRCSMEKETFDYLWKQFDKTIKSVESQFEKDVKEKWHFRRVYGQEYSEIIHSEYDEIRDQLKSRCYKRSVEGGINDNKIDQHKIAACFCYAFLRRKAFSFDLNDDISPEMLLSNYQLAYLVSLQVIYLCLIDLYLSYKDEKKHILADKLQHQGTLLVPETTKTHDTYHIGRIKTLALNEYHNISFDLLSYADMMYWVEHYNRQLLECSYNVSATDPNKRYQD